LESTFRRTTGFVIATFVIMKVGGYEKMPLLTPIVITRSFLR
jgi:hypothetical protein